MRDNIKNNIIIVLTVIVVMILSAFIYEMYYMSKQSDVNIIPEEYFHIVESDDMDLSDVSKKWVEEYVLQYMQKYLNRRKTIEEFNITNITILDEEDKQVSVEFIIKPKVRNSSMFTTWGYMQDGGTIRCEWILKFETTYKESGKIWYVIQNLNRGAYEFGQYVISDKSNEDKEYYNFMNKKRYQDLETECTYKIEDGKLYFTYDNSNTWNLVNIDEFDGMLNSDSYKLDEGFYRISTDITYIYYDGRIAISKDRSNSFSIIDCSKLEGDVTYIYFKDVNTGYIVLAVDYAMGRYCPVIYKTEDGGKNFEVVKESEEIGWLRREAIIYAFNEDLIYILDPSADATNSTLKVSTDGFRTFNNVILPKGSFTDELDNQSLDFFDIYDTYEMPKIKDGKFILVINQGSDGDYKGGIKVAYESEDGINWTFIEEFKPTPEPWEG